MLSGRFNANDKWIEGQRNIFFKLHWVISRTVRSQIKEKGRGKRWRAPKFNIKSRRLWIITFCVKQGCWDLAFPSSSVTFCDGAGELAHVADSSQLSAVISVVFYFPQPLWLHQNLTFRFKERRFAAHVILDTTRKQELLSFISQKANKYFTLGLSTRAFTPT